MVLAHFSTLATSDGVEDEFQRQLAALDTRRGVVSLVYANLIALA